MDEATASQNQKLQHTRGSIDEAPVIYTSAYRYIKRGIDVIAAALAILFLLPAFLMIGLLIKFTSPGPVLYTWDVIGRGGRPFRGYKFRTMVVNADELKKDLWQYSERNGPTFKMQNDPRITPVGRILRRFSLDELTPEVALARLQPDVHCKGADYAPPHGKPIPEAPLVESYGGRIVFLPLVNSLSTSTIIRQIQERAEASV